MANRIIYRPTYLRRAMAYLRVGSLPPLPRFSRRRGEWLAQKVSDALLAGSLALLCFSVAASV